MKRLLGIVALLVSAVGMITVGAEVFVRIFLPQNLVLIRGDVWIPHERYGWATAPHLDVNLSAGESPIRFLTDADGYRVGSAGRRDAELRILAIGDSFLQAVEVNYEETFAALLEEQLTRDLGRTVAVVNSGVGDWSPNQYRLQIPDALRAERYDGVVVFLYLGNDIMGRRVAEFAPRAPTLRHDLRLPRDLSHREIVDAVLYPINDVLEERSHFFTFLKDRALLLRMKFGLTSIQMPNLLHRSEKLARNWSVTASILAEIRNVAAEHDIPCAVVLIPSIHEVDREYVARYVSFLGIDASEYDFDQAAREMQRHLESRGVQVVDATLSLRAAYEAGGAHLYDRVTVHLSPAGHRAVADASAAPLRALLQGR